jgi:prepilin-type N-terminal cleavage/methylation domain-containing protein
MKLVNRYHFKVSRGFTLIELMTAIGISSFVFAVMGFMTFVSARSAINIHQQSITQLQASTASEGITRSLRNAKGFTPVSPDTGVDPVTRIYMDMPDTPDSNTTYTVCLYTGDDGKKEVRYYKKKVTSWVGTNPSDSDYERKYRVQDFSMLYESQYRMEITTSFTYKAFALVFENPGLPQHGDFITEAIAKNHFVGEGVDDYTNTTATVAQY